jgi:hypothetical protein
MLCRRCREKFVNSTALQSALREWTMLIRSPRLWATFAIVVLVFVATGPSGTMEDMGLAERAAFWTLLHAAAWAVAICVITLGEIWFAGWLRSTVALLAVNAVIATPFVALAVELIRWSWMGVSPSGASYGQQLLVCLPLSVLFSLLTHLTMSAAQSEAGGARDISEGPPLESPEPPPLLARLKPELRGAILHLTVEDHYTVVTTSRGRQLILLRFSDALRELGATDGLRTHRSHWVAADQVAALGRSEGRLVIRLKTGAEIPVSRSYAEAVRLRFGQV